MAIHRCPPRATPPTLERVLTVFTLDLPAVRTLVSHLAPGSGTGMTFPPVDRMAWGWCHRPRRHRQTLIRGMTTGLSAGREALCNVDVAIGAVGRPGGINWRTHVIDTGDIGAFLGLDVGKGEHHATAVTPAGKEAFDKRLPNSEPKLRDVFCKLQAKHGTVLVVVDHP